MTSRRIRKQACDLTAGDFAEWPVWEYALDEEGEEGQDEGTVRPLPRDVRIDPAEGTYLVRARFELADGSELSGCLLLPAGSGANSAKVQPNILCSGGHVALWCGMFEPSRTEIDARYGRLGKSGHAEVFPLHFVSDVDCVGGPVRGELAGFAVLEDWHSSRTRFVR